ncbi:MAG: hypothetical protein ACRDQA_03485 [Nocardioidaceae bacterium]
MPIAVEGLRQAIKDMESAGFDVTELKTVMGKIARTSAKVMQRYTPSKTGALRRSERGNKAKGKAVVTAGKARVKYAGVQNYGWRARNIEAHNFITKTDQRMSQTAPRMLIDGINAILQEHNL